MGLGHMAPQVADCVHLAVAVELVAAEVAEHEQLGAERVHDAGQDPLVDFEHGDAGRPRLGEDGAMPDVRLAPVALLMTGSPVRARAAASSRVVVVLPFVADTSATRWPAASSASASGASAFITRPLIVAPCPRPVTRDSQPAARPAATAMRVRSDRRLMRARTSTRRRGTGCAGRCAPRVGMVSEHARTSSSTCSRSAGGSTATWLTDSMRSTTPSGVIDCSWRNVAAWSGPNRAGSRGAESSPLLVVAPRRPLLDAVHDRPHLVHPVDERSRAFQIRPTRPPGRSTRANSAKARSASNQWNAWATVTASRDAIGERECLGDGGDHRHAGHGRDEPAACHRPARPRAVAPNGTRRRVNLPVPAARSRTVRPGPSPRLSASHATASGGYDGRTRSYVSASLPNPCSATSWTAIAAIFAGGRLRRRLDAKRSTTAGRSGVPRVHDRRAASVVQGSVLAASRMPMNRAEEQH